MKDDCHHHADRDSAPSRTPRISGGDLLLLLFCQHSYLTFVKTMVVNLRSD
jgi:hypothetical protein